MQTARTRLRRFTLHDLDNLHQLYSDPEIMKHTASRVPQTRTKIRERLLAWMDRDQRPEALGVWAVELLETREFIGWFMLLETEFEFPEIGFMFLRAHQGQGYATEVTRALVEHAFTRMGLGGVCAVVDADNERSKRVLLKVGFRALRTVLRLDTVLGGERELRIFEIRCQAPF